MKIFIYTWYFLRSVSLRGFFNTARLLTAEGKYEKKFGIQTSAIKKSDSKEFFHYQGAGYLAVLRILKDVFNDTNGFDFMDIGCGKGRAVFVAEYCGYNNLMGIELDAELLKDAEANLKTYPFKRPASKLQFIHANALAYNYSNRPTVYFFFNPFNELVMGQVLKRIITASNHETWFIYMNPLYQKPFAENNIKPVKEFKTGRYLEAIVYKANVQVG